MGDRLFLIYGVSRTRQLHGGLVDIIQGFGNQFVVDAAQAKWHGTMIAMQRSWDMDMVVVADIEMKATQQSSLQCPEDEPASSTQVKEADRGTSLGKEARNRSVVKHVLRMEMTL